MHAKARAHANIALIKYWGKADEALALPNNSSLSLTLDKFYTETEVRFQDDLDEDIFYLNGKQDEATLLKVTAFVDQFRKLKGIETRVFVESINYVPTAAGLASSASAFAALGAAVNEALDLGLSKQELSTYVRKGSGSATRSVYGGLVQWHKGYDHESSYAEKIDDANFDIGMIAVIVNASEKKVSSREGMKQTIDTSPFYDLWPQEAEADLLLMKEAIKEQDIDKIGEIAERNAMKMHATMMAANPSIIYFEPDTLRAIQVVKELRTKGISAYYTMDAGPNVKIICRLSEKEIIKDALLKYFKEENVIVASPGAGVTII